MSFLVELSIIALCFGTMCAYIIAVGDILNASILTVFSTPDWVTRELLMCFFACFIMFPLSLFEKINSLRFASLFGILSIFFLVFSTVFHSMRNVADAGFDSTWGNGDINYWPESFHDLLKAMPIVMFAFTCQTNVFTIYEELNNSSTEKMEKVSRRGVGTVFLTYIFMGAFGYLDFAAKTQGNVLNNYCIKETHDPIMIMAFVCITITVTMAFPLNVLPCRFSIESILKRSLPARYAPTDHTTSTITSTTASASTSTAPLIIAGESTTLLQCEQADDLSAVITATTESNHLKLHFFITVLICGMALMVAVTIPNIQIVFELMGATTSSFVCFVLPAMFAVKLDLMKNESRLWGFGVYALLIGGFVAGVTSTAMIIYGLVEKEEAPFFECPAML
jgi:amino acid permease